jgi:hypothetical protein
MSDEPVIVFQLTGNLEFRPSRQVKNSDPQGSESKVVSPDVQKQSKGRLRGPKNGVQSECCGQTTSLPRGGDGDGIGFEPTC